MELTAILRVCSAKKKAVWAIISPAPSVAETPGQMVSTVGFPNSKAAETPRMPGQGLGEMKLYFV